LQSTVIHSIVPIHRAFHFSVSIIANICVRQLTGPGVYLTDLTFIEDGIPSLIKKTAEVIRDIQQYQNVPYPLQPVPELQDYILTNMQSAGDVHEMYEMSLSVEPREREDEKIARYTQYFFPQRQQAD
jgi:son of sevenless-like protein